MKLKIILPILFVLFVNLIFAQNISVTDDNSYSADPSAIFDIKSSSKGLLIPRMTSDEIIAIQNPATGLMVFNTEKNSQYFYNGTGWYELSNYNSYWVNEGDTTVVFSGVGTKVFSNGVKIKSGGRVNIEQSIDKAIGSSFLTAKKGGVTFFNLTDTAMCFGSGNTVTVNSGGRVNIEQSIDKAIGSSFITAKKGTKTYLDISDQELVYSNEGTSHLRGGSLVLEQTAEKSTGSSFFTLKKGSNTYLNITDKEMVYSNDGISLVTGRSIVMEQTAERAGSDTLMLLKSSSTDYLMVGKNSTYVTIDNAIPESPGSYSVRGNSTNGIVNYLSITKPNTNILFDAAAAIPGYPGGFAVGGISGARAITNYLTVTTPNTNIFFDATAAIPGNPAGFSINGDYGGNSREVNYFSITPDSIRMFVGNAAGSLNVTIFEDNATNFNLLNVSSSNTSFGYKSGVTGSANTFIGEMAGISTLGNYNVSIGYSAGSNLNGEYNNTMGFFAGSGSVGDSNIFLGKYAGYLNEGFSNIAIGIEAGNHKSGERNIDLGVNAGAYGTGSLNVNIGNNTGTSSNGNNNIFIGSGTGYNSDGNDNIYIGNNVTETLNPVSNMLRIGNGTYSIISGAIGAKTLELDANVTITDVLNLTPKATEPTAPVEGQLYVNTNGHIYCYLGSVWKQLD